jgi:metal-responsive CopG/Arc/MetJ family transcriptional regulator
MVRSRSWTEDEKGSKVSMSLPPTLWLEVRRLALEEGRSASALVVEALQILLKQRKEASGKAKKQ